MDEILHHLESVGNRCLLAVTSFQGLLGGAEFRPSTVGMFAVEKRGNLLCAESFVRSRRVHKSGDRRDQLPLTMHLCSNAGQLVLLTSRRVQAFRGSVFEEKGIFRRIWFIP